MAEQERTCGGCRWYKDAGCTYVDYYGVRACGHWAAICSTDKLHVVELLRAFAMQHIKERRLPGEHCGGCGVGFGHTCDEGCKLAPLIEVVASDDL